MTAPCIPPPVVVVSRAARIAWRLKHPFHPGVHAASAHVAPPASVVPAAGSPAVGCEGLVAPEGGRFLPALPGGKPAILAGPVAAGGGAVAAAATIAGAAVAGATAVGAAITGAGGGSGTGGFGAGGFGAGRATAAGSPPTTVPFTLPANPGATAAPIGDNGFAGPRPGRAGTMPDGSLSPQGPFTTADTVVTVPAPGATTMFACAAVLVMVVRWTQRRGQ